MYEGTQILKKNEKRKLSVTPKSKTIWQDNTHHSQWLPCYVLLLEIFNKKNLLIMMWIILWHLFRKIRLIHCIWLSENCFLGQYCKLRSFYLTVFYFSTFLIHLYFFFMFLSTTRHNIVPSNVWGNSNTEVKWEKKTFRHTKV